MRRFLAVVLVAWPAVAAADLYRWVDPETGSVKFSSYPPPWYGDNAKARRAPKVERIPERSPAPAFRDEQAPAADAPAPEGPAAAPAPAPATAALEARRKALLAEFAALRQREDFERAGPGLRAQFEAYKTVADELDRMDPKGAGQRVAEARPVLERAAEGLREALGEVPPAVPRAVPREVPPAVPRAVPLSIPPRER